MTDNGTNPAPDDQSSSLDGKEWILMAIGAAHILFVLLGAYFVYETRAFNARAMAVDAEVIDVLRRSSDVDTNTSGLSYVYRPKLSYLYQGETYEHYTDSAQRDYDFPIGTRLQAFVDPEDPSDIRLSITLWSYLNGAIFLLVGLAGMAMFIGIGVHFKRERLRREQSDRN